MPARFDLSDERLSRALTETVGWCARQKVADRVEESDDIRVRRELVRQATELTRRAYEERNSFWNKLLGRTTTDSPHFRRAQELYGKADLAALPSLPQQLRSPELSPKGSIGDLCEDSERLEMVASVVARRSELLSATDRNDVRDFRREQHGGKLLLYVPSENFADGASAYASLGFFDDNDAPPWDTWVAFISGTLLSWVPGGLVALVQAGLDANMVMCVRWMEEAGL